MEELIYKLLEQTPVVIALGVGIYATWKEKKQAFESAEKERKAHRKEIKDLQQLHSQELKELNALVRQHEKEHLEAIDSLTDALEKLSK